MSAESRTRRDTAPKRRRFHGAWFRPPTPPGVPPGLWLHVATTLLLSTASLSAGEAVALEYKGAPGQTLAYRFTCATDAEMQIGGKSMTVASQGSVTVTETIAAVDERNQLTVRFSFPAGSVSSTLNGRVVSTPLAFPPVEMTMTRTGNPLAVRLLPGKSTAGNSPATPLSADLFRHLRCLRFPATAVQPGDSWSASGALPRPSGQSAQVTGTSQLTGVEEHDGVRCAVIHSRMTMPLDSVRKMLGLTTRVTGEATVASTTWFDVTAGRVQEVLGTERARRTIQLSAEEKQAGEEHGSQTTLQLTSTTTFTMKRSPLAP